MNTTQNSTGDNGESMVRGVGNKNATPYVVAGNGRGRWD